MGNREHRKPKKDTAAMDALTAWQEEARPFFERRRAVAKNECSDRLETLRQMHVDIKCAGGNCPVQIEGFVKGAPFYFRARGAQWSIGIGGDPIGKPDWYYEEDYGSWPYAGWMHLHEAYDFMISAFCKWRPNLAQAVPDMTTTPSKVEA